MSISWGMIIVSALNSFAICLQRSACIYFMSPTNTKATDLTAAIISQTTLIFQAVAVVVFLLLVDEPGRSIVIVINFLTVVISYFLVPMIACKSTFTLHWKYSAVHAIMLSSFLAGFSQPWAFSISFVLMVLFYFQQKLHLVRYATELPSNVAVFEDDRFIYNCICCYVFLYLAIGIFIIQIDPRFTIPESYKVINVATWPLVLDAFFTVTRVSLRWWKHDPVFDKIDTVLNKEIQ